jgi:hypothetical protein
MGQFLALVVVAALVLLSTGQPVLHYLNFPQGISFAAHFLT